MPAAPSKPEDFVPTPRPVTVERSRSGSHLPFLNWQTSNRTELEPTSTTALTINSHCSRELEAGFRVHSRRQIFNWTISVRSCHDS